MFEESLVESTPLLRTHNRWPALISLFAQLCAAALILALPLLHPELLPLPHLLSATLAPPRPPAPPPPLLHLRPVVSSSPSATAAVSSAPTTQIFRPLLHPFGPPVDAPALPSINLGNGRASLPLGINSAPSNGPHITVAQPTSRPSSAPTRISSGVLAGLLLAPIRPDYPPIARAAHTEGTVVVDAVISRTGSIESAHVLSGPPMLQPAALDAVRRARYRPFLLNGQPTEVQTTITIRFQMNE